MRKNIMTKRDKKEFVKMVCEMLNMKEVELRKDTENLLEDGVPSGIAFYDDKPQYILLNNMNDIIGEEKVLSTYFMLANQLRQYWQMLNWSDEDYAETNKYIDSIAFALWCIEYTFGKTLSSTMLPEEIYDEIIQRAMEINEELCG